MRSLEDELREAYRSVTGTVREQDLPGLYQRRARCRRRSRFSAFAPLAAAAAVVVAVGFGLVMPGLLSAPGRLAAPTAIPATPRTTPPFMIIVNTPNARRPLAVVSAATGRTTATVAVPRKGTVWFDVAPTASGTRFIVAATLLRGGLCNPTYLYTLTLLASGMPASLRPWTVPVVHAEIGSLSASADGGTLAFVQTACRGPDQQIGIIRGGRMKTWREPYPLFADDLSRRPAEASSGMPSPPSPAGARECACWTPARHRAARPRPARSCTPTLLLAARPQLPSARTSPRCTFPG